MNINKAELWKDRISECKTSGLLVTEWCHKNDLTKAKYYYGHKIINESVVRSSFITNEECYQSITI